MLLAIDIILLAALCFSTGVIYAELRQDERGGDNEYEAHK